MNFYFAGASGLGLKLLDRSVTDRRFPCCFLASFADRVWVDRYLERPHVRLFLDSGAFSVKSRAARIQLDDYIRFVLARQNRLELIAALDVIPESDSRDSVVRAAETSLINYNKMLNAGVLADKLLPCYHYAEPESFLVDIMKVADYIALGGVARRSDGERTPWLSRVLRLLYDRGLRSHGFGVSSFRLMKAFGWTSLDSTAWLSTMRYDALLIPEAGDYLRPPIVFPITDRSPALKSGREHLITVGYFVKEVVREYVENLGFSVDEAKEHGTVRQMINAVFYKRFAEEKISGPGRISPRGFLL